MAVLKAMMNSKKFWYSVVGLVMAVVGNIKPEWSGVIEQMLHGVIALVIGQGIADINKETVDK